MPTAKGSVGPSGPLELAALHATWVSWAQQYWLRHSVWLGVVTKPSVEWLGEWASALAGGQSGGVAGSRDPARGHCGLQVALATKLSATACPRTLALVPRMVFAALPCRAAIPRNL